MTKISTDESPNMKHMERTSMLTTVLFVETPFGLAPGFPILPILLRRISLSEKKEKTRIPNQVFHIFFLYKTLYVKCSICELLVLNPDLDPLVIVFQDIDDQNFNRWITKHETYGTHFHVNNSTIRGNTFWFGTRVPHTSHTSQEDFTFRKEGKDKNPKPGFSYFFSI